MFRNYLTAALRNLVRNKLYAAINITGLAIGFAAAILAALFVRYELTYDQWIPNHENIYQITTTIAPLPGATATESESTLRETAEWLKADFSEVEVAARWVSFGSALMRRGDVRAIEPLIGDVDPSLLSIFHFPVVAGDFAAAFDRPDGIILTRKIALKYFGRDNPIGESIEVLGHSMQVAAVIEDWPMNSTIPFQALFSSRAPISKIAQIDAQTFSQDTEPFFMMVSATFLRLKPGTSVEALQRELPAFVDRHVPKHLGDVNLTLRPLASRHLEPVNKQLGITRALITAAIYGVASVGLLTLVAAVLNFINLMTARAPRRAVEVGVRRVTGANRHALIMQFVGESTLYAAFGMMLALIFVAIFLPSFRVLFNREIVFDLRHDPILAIGVAAVALMTGVLAGAYPAFILSSFRPTTALKAARIKTGKWSGVVRRGLVTVQFAILIGMVVGTAVIYRQTNYLMNESLRFDKDQVLTIQFGCTEKLKAALSALPGVRDAACSWGQVSGGYISGPLAVNGAEVNDVVIDPVDFGYFEVYGVKPLVGRLFDPKRVADSAQGEDHNPPVIINESAMRKFGFASPGAALEQSISWRRTLPSQRMSKGRPLQSSQIIGVVPDFSLSEQFALRPVVYYADIRMSLPGGGGGYTYGATLNVKLTGRDVPETLQAIDRLWDELDITGRPIQRSFIDQVLQFLYSDTTRQAQLFSVFAGVAIFIACLGLLGLSAFAAERRTKEIGVRKALGATRGDILRLLIWDFVKPVLWANVIAWPFCYVVMGRWLQGFVFHIDLEPPVFLFASALALCIAVVTVTGHALFVARAQPVTALRYE